MIILKDGPLEGDEINVGNEEVFTPGTILQTLEGDYEISVEGDEKVAYFVPESAPEQGSDE